MRKPLIHLLLVALAWAAAGSVAARGPWRAHQGNTPGWSLMTPEERVEHQARIRGFRRIEDCRAYQQEHHGLMETRAQLRGLPLREGGHDFCLSLLPGTGERNGTNAAPHVPLNQARPSP